MIYYINVGDPFNNCVACLGHSNGTEKVSISKSIQILWRWDGKGNSNIGYYLYILLRKKTQENKTQNNNC